MIKADIDHTNLVGNLKGMDDKSIHENFPLSTFLAILTINKVGAFSLTCRSIDLLRQ